MTIGLMFMNNICDQTTNYWMANVTEVQMTKQQMTEWLIWPNNLCDRTKNDQMTNDQTTNE